MNGIIDVGEANLMDDGDEEDAHGAPEDFKQWQRS